MRQRTAMAKDGGKEQRREISYVTTGEVDESKEKERDERGNIR